MKKLILAILLIAGFTFAQTNGYLTQGGAVWTDTLGYTNVNQTKDSVLIIDVGFGYDWFKITVEGNSNSPVDSFYVQAGAVRYNESGSAQDTIWGSWLAVKDSSWGDINTMINNSVGKDFLIFTPIAQLLKFTLLNNRANLVTRDCVITINAKKD